MCIYQIYQLLAEESEVLYKENQIQLEESKSENFLKMVSFIYFIVSEINILIKFR